MKRRQIDRDPRNAAPVRLLAALALVLGLHGAARAAAPDPASRLVVVYIDASRSGAEQTAAALRAYGVRTRAEPGAVSVQLLREAARPDRFVLVERWRDEAALDAHDGAARMDLQRTLAPLLSGPLDERIAVPLTAAGSAPGSKTSVQVVIHIDVVPEGKEAATGWIVAQAAAAMKMPGAEGFDVAVQANRLNHFQVHETWASRAAYDAYLAGPGRALRSQLATVKGAPFDDRLFVGD